MMSDFKHGVAYEMFLGSKVPTFKTAFWVLLTYGKIVVCYVRGHRLEDHGFGSRESGCVDIYCDRCGFRHHVTLY